MILETLFSITLFISGGHLLSTNLKLHHYSDEDAIEHTVSQPKTDA